MLLDFFNKNQAEPKITLIDYDENTKTKKLFCAVAQGLVSLIKSSKLSDVQVLKSFLENHANYYPRQLPKHIQNLPVNEQLEYLLIYNHPHLEVLIPAMAHTLQQSVVDVVCKSPEIYGNLLLEGKTVGQLRKAENLDHTSILQALADEILHINIYLERYCETYLLPVKEYYLSVSNNQDHLYLHYKDRFYTTENETIREE